MNNKVTISIVIIFFVVVIGFGIWIFNFRNNSITENNNFSKGSLENNITNAVNISDEYITDDCLNEWNDYAKTINENIESVSTDMVDENSRYLVKNVNGYIYIYYLDNSNEETLYKKTDISTEYLSVEDLDDLEIGIEVTGAKELNKLLEDFE